MNPSDHPKFNHSTAQTLIIAVTLLAVLAMYFSYRTAAKAGHVIAQSIRDAFSTNEKITQTFRSEVERVISTRGNVLELAVSESNEYFRKDNERRALGGNVYLGKTSAQIDVRCTFRYHLQLADAWRLEVRSNLCLVHAPRFRATLPVAIQTGTMRKNAESGWARFDKHELMDSLQASMSDELAVRAVDEQHIRAVRETCRASVRDFVQNWLLREEQWREGRFTSIIVQFPDDPEPFPNDTSRVIRRRD